MKNTILFSKDTVRISFNCHHPAFLTQLRQEKAVKGVFSKHFVKCHSAPSLLSCLFSSGGRGGAWKHACEL